MTIDRERREPRCRICRHESVRVQVNQLLGWRGVPTTWGQRRSHKVTYADILRDLEPLNDGRDQRDRITYDSLWNHAKRHYEIDGIVTYWSSRMTKEFIQAFTRQRGVDQERSDKKLQ